MRDRAVRGESSKIAGDTRAIYERMVETYYRVVYGIAMRALGDANLAETVTVTVYSELLTSGRLGEPETAGAWLVLNARRESIEILRRSDAATLDGLLAVKLEDGFLPTASDCKLWTREAALAALYGLSTDERTVIDLGYFQGLTYRQIAARTGLDAEHVKACIRSGLAVLVAPRAAVRSPRMSRRCST